MEARRFDDITRSLLNGSRRRAFKGIAGTAVGGGAAAVGLGSAGAQSADDLTEQIQAQVEGRLAESGVDYDFDDAAAQTPPPFAPGDDDDFDDDGSGFITEELIDDNTFDPATETPAEFVSELTGIDIGGGGNGDDDDDDGGGNDFGFMS